MGGGCTGGMCTKNGSYCEKEKKSRGGGGGGGGGVRVDVYGEVEAFVKNQKKKIGGGGGGGVSGWM